MSKYFTIVIICILIFCCIIFILLHVTTCHRNEMSIESMRKCIREISDNQRIEISLINNTISIDSITVVDGNSEKSKVKKSVVVDSIINLSTIVLCDSLMSSSNDKYKVLQDSLFNTFVTTVQNRHNEHLSKLDNALLDIRQETNNNLTKIETRVTLWMGILAFIGIFIPVFLQLNLRKEIDKMEIRINDSQKKLDSEVFKVQINSFVGCILILYSASNSNEENIQLINKLFSLLKKKTEEITVIYNFQKGVDQKEKAADLLLCLVEYRSLFRKLHPYFRNEHKVIFRIDSTIKILSNLLVNTIIEDDKPKINRLLRNFVNEVAKLSIS